MEKRPGGWKLGLARNTKNGKQLSKGRPWPKFHSSQLTPDGKKQAQLRKRRSTSEYCFTPGQWHGPVPRGGRSSDHSLNSCQGRLSIGAMRAAGERAVRCSSVNHTLRWMQVASGVDRVSSPTTLGGLSVDITLRREVKNNSPYHGATILKSVSVGRTGISILNSDFWPSVCSWLTTYTILSKPRQLSLRGQFLKSHRSTTWQIGVCSKCMWESFKWERKSIFKGEKLLKLKVFHS